jgi:hypothetical protein
MIMHPKSQPRAPLDYGILMSDVTKDPTCFLLGSDLGCELANYSILFNVLAHVCV